MNEYDLIRGLFGRDVPDLFASDAQFFATGGGEWGVTCDAFCAEDDGFDPRDPRLFAANVVRGTLSDLAASGCEPAFFLQAVSFPRGASAAWLAAWAEGLREALAEAGCVLLGGRGGRPRLHRHRPRPAPAPALAPPPARRPVPALDDRPLRRLQRRRRRGPPRARDPAPRAAALRRGVH